MWAVQWWCTLRTETMQPWGNKECTSEDLCCRGQAWQGLTFSVYVEEFSCTAPGTRLCLHPSSPHVARYCGNFPFFCLLAPCTQLFASCNNYDDQIPGMISAFLPCDHKVFGLNVVWNILLLPYQLDQLKKYPLWTLLSAAVAAPWPETPLTAEAALFPFSHRFPGLAPWLPPPLLPLLWNSLFLDWKQTPKPPQTVFFCLKKPILCILYIQSDLLTVWIRHPSPERAGRNKVMCVHIDPSVPPDC